MDEDKNEHVPGRQNLPPNSPLRCFNVLEEILC